MRSRTFSSRKVSKSNRWLRTQMIYRAFLLYFCDEMIVHRPSVSSVINWPILRNVRISASAWDSQVYLTCVLCAFKSIGEAHQHVPGDAHHYCGRRQCRKLARYFIASIKHLLCYYKHPYWTARHITSAQAISALSWEKLQFQMKTFHTEPDSVNQRLRVQCASLCLPCVPWTVSSSTLQSQSKH